MAIIRNSARCLRCGDEIESKHVHDFVSCSCGAIAVDGGKEYFKRSAEDLALLQDTSEVGPDEPFMDSFGEV
jgi:hypothetical protein